MDMLAHSSLSLVLRCLIQSKSWLSLTCILHCLARPRCAPQCHVRHLLHPSCAQGAPSLPGPASAGALQCGGGPHWHLHPPGHCDAADQERGDSECLQRAQELARPAHEDGPDKGELHDHSLMYIIWCSTTCATYVFCVCLCITDHVCRPSMCSSMTP